MSSPPPSKPSLPYEVQPERSGRAALVGALRAGLPWLFPALVLAALATWLCTRAPLPLAGGADARTSKLIAREVRAAEPAFRREALEMFPGDPWSQDDHFAVREMGLVEKLAKRHALRIGAVLAAIDRDIKRGGPNARERGRVAPCMPRPFYE